LRTGGVWQEQEQLDQEQVEEELPKKETLKRMEEMAVSGKGHVEIGGGGGAREDFGRDEEVHAWSEDMDLIDEIERKKNVYPPTHVYFFYEEKYLSFLIVFFCFFISIQVVLIEFCGDIDLEILVKKKKKQNNEIQWICLFIVSYV
jgi:hypothetical protein